MNYYDFFFCLGILFLAQKQVTNPGLGKYVYSN